MKNIKLKLTKSFMMVISLTVIISFLISGALLSRFYIKGQYKELETLAIETYDVVKEEGTIEDISITINTNVKVVLVDKNGKVIPLWKKGHNGMGVRPFLDNHYALNKIKGEFKNTKGELYLFYNYKTDIGNIIVFKNKLPIDEYLNLIYIVFVVIFIIGIFLSFPVAYYIGDKFTKPVLKLEEASRKIAEDDFTSMEEMNEILATGDEIQKLWESFSYMSSQIQAKHKLQKEFVANVSHDFKTPLSIIRNYSEAINDEILSKGQVKQYSRDIIEEVDRLNNLVNELLQLSKLQAGEIKLNKEYLNLRDFLTSMGERFKTLLLKKNLTISINSPSVEILGDKNALYRVFENFINNSIKFSKEGTIIELKAEIYEYDTEKDETKIENLKKIKEIKDRKIFLRISVKDNGIGIAPEMLKDIWNRYYKHSQSGGMGLGLPISSEILKLHNFKYGVESKLGEGTEIYFIVPYDSMN